VAFVLDIVVSVLVSLVTRPKPESELVGLVYSETPKAQRSDPDVGRRPWYQSPTKLAGISLVLVVVLNIVFH
jgi:SSS family solute:Na+ symporter